MPNAVIGRAKERAVLEAVLTANKPQFVAVYGRRRVGKTYLIRHFAESKQVIFFDVTGARQAPMLEQIKNFTDRIGEVFYGGVRLVYERSWSATFKLLTEAMAKAESKVPIILFFDEFPWMVTKNSKLLSALDYYWNQYWSRDNRIKLIICGSSASWIINKIINHKGGLHNRVTHSILLEAFNLKETKEYLASMGIKYSNQQVTEIYMATGGVAHYLEKVKKRLSVTQNIEQLAFEKKSFFSKEFDNLFSSLFDDAELYTEIVRCIAKNKSGTSQEEVFAKVKALSRGGRALSKLKALEETGFIISFVSGWHTKKGVYYRVIDEYVLFYLTWIEPIITTLMKKGLRAHYWEGARGSAAWASWAGYAFESLCYKHLHQINEALHLSPMAIPDTWRYVPSKGVAEEGAQIDLLFDREDDSITVCEIKYTNSPFVIDKNYAAVLNRKVQVFKTRTRTKKQVFLALISASGLKPSMYSEEMLSGVVKLDDFFNS